MFLCVHSWPHENRNCLIAMHLDYNYIDSISRIIWSQWVGYIHYKIPDYRYCMVIGNLRVTDYG